MKTSRKTTLDDSLIQSREIEDKFNHLPIKAHAFRAGIPRHSFDFVELKGGNERMKMDEIYRITGLNHDADIELGVITKALFGIRGLIGRVLGWDDVPELIKRHTWITRLTQAEREKSLIPSGQGESISRVHYCYENEILFEIINRTVHCFWVVASVEEADGYDLYFAIYVKKLNWRPPVYMTLISPIVKRIVYPAMKKNIERNWQERFSTSKNMSGIELNV